ncbi:hypothetical protein C8R46DRAFT_1217994 [Mycena filopes]|nr:hypothetical protein C8R46DRAFT_1217994 [Mycena filopes]
MAGIHSLAPEVLALILAEARQDLPLLGIAILRLRRDVCMVSKDWQRNALADPQWWTSVWLVPFLLLPFMHYGLSAAPDNRLDITIDMDEYLQSLPRTERYIRIARTTFLAAVAAFLKEHLHRVHGLHVLGLTPQEWRFIAPFAVGCTGLSLRTLEFSAPVYQEGWITAEEVVVAAWASLTTIIFDGVEPLPTGVGIYSRLHTLKLMRIIAMRTDFLLSILREATALVRLDLDHVECTDPGAGSFSVPMTMLLHLRIAYREDQHLDVLGHIAAPQLQSFCIQAGRSASSASIVSSCGGLIEQASEIEIGVPDAMASQFDEVWRCARQATSISIRTSWPDIMHSMRQYIRSRLGAFPQLRFVRVGDHVDRWDVLDFVETADPPANMIIVCPIRESRPTSNYIQWTIQGQSITSQGYEGNRHRYHMWDEMGTSRRRRS